jgi:hypothetical protein
MFIALRDPRLMKHAALRRGTRRQWTVGSMRKAEVAGGDRHPSTWHQINRTLAGFAVGRCHDAGGPRRATGRWCRRIGIKAQRIGMIAGGMGATDGMRELSLLRSLRAQCASHRAFCDGSDVGHARSPWTLADTLCGAIAVIRQCGCAASASWDHSNATNATSAR